MTEKQQSESYIVSRGRQAGIGLHVSSLPGKCGIGDIADSSMSFVDRLKQMRIGVWQFLPLGPTAYGDSPYQPLSAFAGNANLIGLNPLVRLGLLDSSDTDILSQLPQSHVDYGALIPRKRALLLKAADRFNRRKRNSLLADYEDFLHRHGERWLFDYALFRVLKTGHGERPWPEWEKTYARKDPVALQKVRNEHREAIERTQITQFLFNRQWNALRHYASDQGIGLFGDMPIYVALDSSDAWSHPELLRIDRDGRPSHVAGVPPDYFSEDGQLWGNPLYDWDYHRQTGYRWWIERMRHTMQQTDLVRIDHFRGFESFWSVPYGETTAKSGEWLPGPGDDLFEALQGALGSLPIVAEDLGLITPQVDRLRENHDLPGMVVLQFEIGNPEFDFDAIDENSVCYTGTHDNDTTLGWFNGSGDDTRSQEEIVRTRKMVLKRTGGTSDSVHEDLIRLAFLSNSTLAIAPLQDYLGLGSEARFNRPGTTLNNWRWRLTEGQLNPAVTDWIRKLVEDTSRSSGKRLDCAL